MLEPSHKNLHKPNYYIPFFIFAVKYSFHMEIIKHAGVNTVNGKRKTIRIEKEDGKKVILYLSLKVFNFITEEVFIYITKAQI